MVNSRQFNAEIRSGRHCTFMIHVHLVFVAKYRKNIFNQVILEDMKSIFEHVCGKFEAELIEFDGEKDHVHLLINYPPKVSISKLVNALKGISSRKLRAKHGQYLQQFYYKGVLWSPSYFAGSCGGASIDVIRAFCKKI